jgi:hypothetical protein
MPATCQQKGKASSQKLTQGGPRVVVGQGMLACMAHAWWAAALPGCVLSRAGSLPVTEAQSSSSSSSSQ